MGVVVVIFKFWVKSNDFGVEGSLTLVKWFASRLEPRNGSMPRVLMTVIAVAIGIIFART